MAGNQVEIVVTSKDKTRSGFQSAKKEGTSFGGVMSRIGQTAGGFLAANFVAGAGSKIVDFFNTSTDAASNLGESLSKSNTIFGSQARQIERWAGAAAENVGLAKGQALDAAAGFGNLFTQLGIGQGQAAAMSKNMVQLGADFASFHNADITEVLEAQSAAFRGEYDSLQRFVPTINAARVEQEALNLTGKKHTKDLTDQDKALAVNNLMFQGAGKARGDFARTSQSAANQERIAAAETANLNAQIGQKLLPVSMALTRVKLQLAKVLAEKVVPALTALGTWIGQNKELLMAVGIGIAAVLVPSFVAWAVSAGTAAAATIAATAPLLLLGAAVAALAFLVIRNWDKIKAWTARTWQSVKDAIAAAFNWVRSHWPLLLGILTGPIGAAVILIVRNWNRIKAGAVAAFNALVSFVKGIPGRILGALGSLASLLFNAGKTVIQGLINGILDQLGPLGSVLGRVGSFIADHKGPIDKDLKLLQPAGEAVMTGLMTGIQGQLPNLDAQLGGISDMIGRGGRGARGAGMPAATASGPVIIEIRSGGSAMDRLICEIIAKSIRTSPAFAAVVRSA